MGDSCGGQPDLVISNASRDGEREDPRANVRECAIRANFICVTKEILRCRLWQHYSGPVAEEAK